MLNVFSPLPPLATDIANCTAAILPPLGARADVRVWTTQDVVDLPDSPGVSVQRYQPGMLPAPLLNQAHLSVFNIGNNALFHRAIHDVSRNVPGVVVLHDTRLQHFFASYAGRSEAERRYYLSALADTHGAQAALDAQAHFDGQLPFEALVERFPMTGAAMYGALAAILHNEAEAKALAAATAVPLFHLPLPFPFGPRRPRPPAGGAARPTQLVVFGFIGTNRRLAQVLAVLAALPNRTDYRLDVYGLLEQPEEIAQEIGRLGLGAIVKLHGFVPETVLDDALSHADLAINLRWPSMGEASGSQLRIWAAELPSIVTRTGWYAGLPPDTVFAVDPERETEQIATHLTAIRRSPDRYAAAGQRGRLVLEELHSPAAYADALLAIAAMRGTLHARYQAVRLAKVAARLAAQAGGRPLARSLAEDVATHVAALARLD